MAYQLSTKTCFKCKVEKPLSDFHKSNIHKQGVKPRCKKCRSEYSKKVNKTPEMFYNRLKNRTKGTYKEVAFSKEEFVSWYNYSKKKCFYCEIPEEYIEKLNFIAPSGFCIKHRLEIDRMDSTKPYAADNVVLACPICNMTKNKIFSSREMMEIGRIVKKKWKLLMRRGLK